MSNVVQFLETLARNPKPLSPEDFAAAIADTSLDPATKGALLQRDASVLNELLGGRPKMICMIAPAENDEPKQDEDGESEEESPEREESRAA